ncbi:MAG: rod shape-determining protein MreD [Salinivirgaceae bacterium]|jgi:rod shape-determining protein MreD|nr:rod shape-determining protein MreD [Salinivirgaceae bacterium]
MIKVLPRNILRFIVLILLQVWVLNNIQFSGFVNPYLYVLFILLLPFETPGWLVLVLSFFLGLSVDMFTDTIGMHASASVFMGFLRSFVLQSIAPRDGYETGTYPRVFYYGFTWFLKYSLLLVFLHHLFLFSIEVFNFKTFYFVLLRTVVSTIFSSILILLSQYLIFRK